MSTTTFNIDDYLTDAIERRDRIHAITSTARLASPNDAAWNYVELNRRAMYMNALLYSYLGFALPLGYVESAKIAGGLLATIALGEGGNRENNFEDSHTVKAYRFAEAVSQATGKQTLKETLATQTIVTMLYPDPFTLGNMGAYPVATTEWFLELLGRSFAAEHSAAKSDTGLDEFGIIAQRFQVLYPELWEMLGENRSWLLEHTGETEGTLEDEHYGHIRRAVNMAGNYCLQYANAKCNEPHIPLLKGITHWYTLLETFFKLWVTV